MRNRVVGTIFLAVLCLTLLSGPGTSMAAVDGIYRPQSDPSAMNLYLQTYTNGSVVAILTPDLNTWYVFLDSDWTDGITNQPDLAGAGHTLTMTFDSDTQATATLNTAGRSSYHWTFKKDFSAPQSSTAPDGIYKQTGVTNLYFQTYTTKSAVLIFTPDLHSWMVFLDPDWTDGIEVSKDLANVGHSLIMTPQRGDTYLAIIHTASGEVLDYTVTKTFDAPASSTPAGDDWTYMVYIAGDNNLSQAAFDDLNEMETAGSTDRVNIVAQFEFSSRYTEDIADKFPNTYRARIEKDSSTQTFSSQVTDIGNKDMGNPQTLTDFIKWAAQTYPAKNYALVLWDHGAGWKAGGRSIAGIRGALQDETSDSFMSLPDLASAVRNAGVHLRILNFDACLMAMYEVAYEFLGLTDYLVASEETEPGAGDPYDLILPELVNNPSMTPQQLAETIARKFKQYYEQEGRSVVTKSVCDMSKVGALDSAITQLAEALNQNLATERPNIQKARDDSIAYEYPANHDLGDFLSRLNQQTSNSTIKSRIADVQSALNSAIVLNEVYGPQAGEARLNSKGLAIYLPQRSQVSNEELTAYDRLAVNQSRAAAGTWGSFVNALVTGDQNEGQQPLPTAEGNFLIGLYWNTDADLDLYVWEPDGFISAPWQGAVTPNGFFSGDSAETLVSEEYYAAAETVQTGDYDILVNCYDTGWSGYAIAQVFVLSSDGSFHDFGSRYMDLSNPAPANWFLDQNEILNVLNGVYSDWWYAGTVTIGSQAQLRVFHKKGEENAHETLSSSKRMQKKRSIPHELPPKPRDFRP